MGNLKEAVDQSKTRVAGKAQKRNLPKSTSHEWMIPQCGLESKKAKAYLIAPVVRVLLPVTTISYKNLGHL